jgi:hypothetical protein
MRLSHTILLLLPLLVAGCNAKHRQGEPLKRDTSKAVRVPRVPADHSKTVRTPVTPDRHPGSASHSPRENSREKTHEKGATDSKVVRSVTPPSPKSAKVSEPAPKASPSPVGAAAKASAAPSAGADSHRASHAPAPATRKTAKLKSHPPAHRRSDDGEDAIAHRAASDAGPDSPSRPTEQVQQPAEEKPASVATAPTAPEPSPVETPSAPPQKPSSGGKPAKEPLVALDAKETASAPAVEPAPEPVGEKETKGAAPKTESTEGEKVAEKSPDKPVANETAPEPAVAPAPSKSGTAPSASAKAGGKVTAQPGQPKLSAAEKKKLSEAQKREEIQKAAEQSYEAGLQFIRESRDADAIKAFRQTVKLSPDSADAWLRLAYLCEKEGKTEEALRAFKEAKRLWSF